MTSSLPDLDPGKMLFSGSDDGSIRLWDLGKRECVMVYEGHVGQVQSLRLLFVDRDKEDEEEEDEMDVGSTFGGLAAGRRGMDVEAHATSYQPNALGVMGPITHPLPHAANLSLNDHRHQSYHPHRPQPVSALSQGMVPSTAASMSSSSSSSTSSQHNGYPTVTRLRQTSEERAISTRSLGKRPLLTSASLDNTVKVWDVESGKVKKTMFGHSEFFSFFLV